MTSGLQSSDVVVRDGSTVCLRPATVDDAEALQRFLTSLSADSLYFRFLGIPALNGERVRALLGDHATCVIAEAASRIVAFAGFYRDADRDRAEVAFAVADALQGHGIGTRLLEYLAGLARAQGIETFDAYVLGGN